MDLEKTNHYANRFQNCILKRMHGLAILDQYEAKAVQVLEVHKLEKADEWASDSDILDA